jgi:hypothetical protein
MHHLARDHVVAPDLLRLRRRRHFRDQRRLADGRKGITQLVCECREELILAPVGLAQGGLSLLATLISAWAASYRRALSMATAACAATPSTSRSARSENMCGSR